MQHIQKVDEELQKKKSRKKAHWAEERTDRDRTIRFSERHRPILSLSRSLYKLSPAIQTYIHAYIRERTFLSTTPRARRDTHFRRWQPTARPLLLFIPLWCYQNGPSPVASQSVGQISSRANLTPREVCWIWADFAACMYFEYATTTRMSGMCFEYK